MTRQQVIPIRNARARDFAARTIAQIQAECEVVIRPASKTREQEEKYHAMIGDIAEQRQHLNRVLDADSWKRLLVDQFRRETLDDEEIGPYWKRHQVTMMPSLDGTAIVALGEQTRKFPKKVASAFIEWLNAWGAESGVRFSAPKRECN